MGSKYGTGLSALPSSFAHSSVSEQNPPLWGALGAEVGAPSIPPNVYYSDNFNRSDGSLTSPWTLASDPTMPPILSNRLRVAVSGGGYQSALFSLPFSTLKQCVKVKAAHSTNLQFAMVYLRYKDASNYVLFTARGGGTASNRQSTIETCIGGVSVQRAAATGFPAGSSTIGIGTYFSDMICTADGNVYSVVVNGGAALTWTDSGNLIPSTDATYNRCSIGGGVTTSSNYVYLDDFEMFDI